MTEDWPRRIAWIHGRVVHRYGIQPGFLTKGAVESLVQKIDLLRPGAFRAAAMLMEGLIRLHPFIDGNKRTALQSSRDYLKQAGYALKIPGDATDFVCGIAATTDTDPDAVLRLIEEWLEGNSSELESSTG